MESEIKKSDCAIGALHKIKVLLKAYIIGLGLSFPVCLLLDSIIGQVSLDNTIASPLRMLLGTLVMWPLLLIHTPIDVFRIVIGQLELGRLYFSLIACLPFLIVPLMFFIPDATKYGRISVRLIVLSIFMSFYYSFLSLMLVA